MCGHIRKVFPTIVICNGEVGAIFYCGCRLVKVKLQAVHISYISFDQKKVIYIIYMHILNCLIYGLALSVPWHVTSLKNDQPLVPICVVSTHWSLKWDLLMLIWQQDATQISTYEYIFYYRNN